VRSKPPGRQVEQPERDSEAQDCAENQYNKMVRS
jgi:hypothetical protein